MPFIDLKTTVKINSDKENIIKQKLGEAISVLGKSENYLMVGFNDDYKLYFAGKQLDKGAFIEVGLFGSSGSDAYNKFTSLVCDIIEEELSIPKNQIYIKYQETNYWGWNGRNF